MEGKTIPFNLAFRPAKEGDLPALWLTVEGVDHLINPFALIESIYSMYIAVHFENEEFLPLILADSQEMERHVFSFCVYFDYGCSQCIWKVEFPDGRKTIWHFSNKEYEERLFVQVSEFGTYLMKNGRSGYGTYLSKQTGGKLMVRLLGLQYNCCYKEIRNIPLCKVEPFSLTLLEEGDDYEIKLGNRSFVRSFFDIGAFFSSWHDNLEEYFDKGVCELELFHDCEKLIIFLTTVEPLILFVDNDEDIDFEPMNLVLVTIQTDESLEQGAIVGFCEGYKVIKGIYSALLEIATRWDSVGPDDEGESRRGKLFSPRIENYLVRNRHREQETDVLKDV